MARGDLVGDLRERIQDNRSSLTSFTLAVTAICQSALLQIRNDMLQVTVIGGQGISSFSINLSAPSTNTAGKVVNYINSLPGYQATPSEVHQQDHDAMDLSVGGLVEIGRKNSTASPAGGTPSVQASPQGAQVQHHLFSDETLRHFLGQAALEHNPNYGTYIQVPAQEHSLILTKAASLCYHALAALSARSKNLGIEAKEYTALAQAQETKYSQDRMYLARSLPVAKVDNNKLGYGDITVGTITRAGLRSNGDAPYGSAVPPTPPMLYDCADDDVEDTQVRIRWERNTEYPFAYFELWRGYDPDVERSVAGRLISRPYTDQLAIESQYSKKNSAVQVFGIYRYFPGDFFFGTWSDLFGLSGQNCSFMDGIIYTGPGSQNVNILGVPLEPNFDYYYRLYGFSKNRDCTPSRVIHIKTKSMKARFARLITQDIDPAAVSPVAGPLSGGTLLTINGTNFAGNIEVRILGRLCTSVTVVSPTRLTCITPAFLNPMLSVATGYSGAPFDIELKSANGLTDLLKGGWTYQ